MVASSATGRSQSTHAARLVCCEQHHGDGEDLCDRIGLAEPAWLEVAPAGGRVEKSGNHQNAKIASEDHHGYAGGDQPM